MLFINQLCINCIAQSLSKLSNKTCLGAVYQPQSEYKVGHITVKLHGASKGLNYILLNNIYILIVDIVYALSLIYKFLSDRIFSLSTCGPNVALQKLHIFNDRIEDFTIKRRKHNPNIENLRKRDRLISSSF